MGFEESGQKQQNKLAKEAARQREKQGKIDTKSKQKKLLDC